MRFATAPAPAAVRPSPSPVPPIDTGRGRPKSYVVVYSVQQGGSELWEVLRVDRPLAGSDLTYRSGGPPQPGDQPISGSISTVTGLYSVGSQGVQLASGRQPGPPSGDQYVGAEISDAVGRGLAAYVGTERAVAGRECSVYRFAKPPSGPLPRLGGGDHDDVCIDGDGLTLAEAWTYHGKVVLQRTAVKIETSDQPVQDAALPAPPDTAGAPATAAAATVKPDPHPQSLLAPPPAPAGFTAGGPALDFHLPDPGSPGQTLAQSVVWTFVRGADVITVEAGAERGGTLPWSGGDTVTAAAPLAGLGPATTAVRSDGYQLRVDLGGSWVRVLGTVPLTELVAYGQLLRRA